MKRWEKGLMVALFLSAFVMVAMSYGGIGLGWDEPDYIKASRLQILWLTQMLSHLEDGSPGRSFSQEVVDQYWRYDPYHNYHPPLHTITSSFIWLISSSFVDELKAYRLSSAFFFSLVVALLYGFTREGLGPRGALFSSLSFLLMPRVFGEAHLVSTDMACMALWFLTIYLFFKGQKRGWPWSIGFGLAFGLSLAAKITSLLLPLPLILWSILYWRKPWKQLICALFIGPWIMLAFSPPWWHHPWQRVSVYVESAMNINLWHPIRTFYLGKTYLGDLPWHHPFVMLSVTTPPLCLALSLLSSVKLFKERLKDEGGTLAFWNVALFLGAMVLPGAPGHDGVRLFLPILPFLAALSGRGYEMVEGWFSSLWSTLRWPLLRAWAPWLLMASLIMPSLYDLVEAWPYPLAYYNVLIGGAKGAHRAGMESTYWLEVANGKFLNFLNAKLPYGASVNTKRHIGYFHFLQEEGLVRKDILFTYQFPSDYYILFCRQGIFDGLDWRFYLFGKPLFSNAYQRVPLVNLYEVGTMRENQ